MGLHRGTKERGCDFKLSQEGQDLSAAAEQLIFKTSSEYQTVDLTNKCMTKDFLRDFRHGFHSGWRPSKRNVGTKRSFPVSFLVNNYTKEHDFLSNQDPGPGHFRQTLSMTGLDPGRSLRKSCSFQL